MRCAAVGYAPVSSIFGSEILDLGVRFVRDPEQFKYLHAYSPYHNVKHGTAYPAVLFTTGDADTRVDPLHARKMTALLQDATGSDNPVLLYYDTKSGHSGGKPISQQIEDSTVRLSFFFWQLQESLNVASKRTRL